MKIKCLILGGNGFIGNNLSKYLVQQGCFVTSFDQVLPSIQNDGVNYVTGDFFEDDDLSNLVMEHDVIYHAISTINPGNSNERYMNGYGRDLVQTIKLCSWMKDSDKKLIFLSSGGTVYGNQEKQPIVEDTLPKPINHYGNVKLCIENALRIFHLQNRMNVRIARISNPYGPGQDYTKGVGFIDATLKKSLANQPIEIWGDGENIRDYIYIEDVCKLLYLLCVYEGEEIIFNISSGHGVSQNQIVESLRELGIDVQVQYVGGRSVDAKKIVLDNTKVCSISDISLIPLSEGIAKYYQYLLENKIC